MRRFITALTLCAIAAAQTPACASSNDSTTSVTTNVTSFGFGGPNTNAWQFTPGTTILVQAVRLFTGNVALTGERYMTVELWDDASGLPGTRLAGGTWKIVNGRGVAWQGTNLDGPVLMNGSSPYWVVWIDPGFSTLPLEPGGTTTPGATRSGVQWIAGAPAALKARLFCNLLDDAYSQPFGPQCPTSTGQLPSAFTNEQPSLGNAGFFYETAGSPSGSLVLLVVGTDPLWPSVPVPGLAPGCLQNTDVAGTLVAFAGTGNVRGPTAVGYRHFPMAIPLNPAFAGMVVGAQVAAFDAAIPFPLPFATSNAQRITLF